MPVRAPRLSIHDAMKPFMPQSARNSMRPRNNPVRPGEGDQGVDQLYAWWLSRDANGLVREATWLGADERTYVRIAAACLRAALPIVDEGKPTYEQAVRVAEEWTEGRANSIACAAAQRQAAKLSRKSVANAASLLMESVCSALLPGLSLSGSESRLAVEVARAAWIGSGLAPAFIDDAARSVLTFDLLRALKHSPEAGTLYRLLLGFQPEPEDSELFLDRLEDGNFRGILTAIREVRSTERRIEKQELALRALVEGIVL